MKASKPTLWIDLTMLLNWSGNLTGIQRVEYNLAKRFAKQDNVSFLIFNKYTKQFLVYDFKHIEFKISELQHKNKIEDIQPIEVDSEIENRPGMKELLFSSAKSKIAPHLPVKTKAFLKNHYHRSNKVSYDDNVLVDFTKGESLLILSGDWSDDIFADQLRIVKQNRDIKVIQVIYDMLPATQPSFFVPGMPEQFSRYMKNIIADSDLLLAISKSTKNDIELFIKENNLPSISIKVFRLGDDFLVHDPVKPNLGIETGKFILCVGTVEPRKNHFLLYYTVKEALARGIKLPPIVITGKKGWLIENFIYLVENDPKISKQIILFNRASDQELAWLFSNCQFTVYPSLYEGWGLPISEALYYGKYTISSNTSSMPEVAGDLIDYFSPNDPITLLEKITSLINNPDKLAEKEKKIKDSYHPTNWDATFSEFSSYINNVNKQ